MMMRQRYQKDTHDTGLRALHAKGYNDNQIALEMGFDPSTIQKHRVALGLDSNAPHYKHRGVEYSRPIGEWPEGVDYR